jgi:hypothetical protein
VAGVAVIGGLALAACSSNTPAAVTLTSHPPAPSTSTSTTLALSAVRGQFVNDENAAESVDTSVENAVDALPGSASVSQVASTVAPLIAAIQTYQTQLTDLPWPSTMVSDAHAVIQDLGAVLGVLQATGQQNGLTGGAWSAQLEAATGSEKAAANTLRHDLGLPPLSTTS